MWTIIDFGWLLFIVWRRCKFPGTNVMTWLLSGKLSGVQIVKTVLAYVVCRENIWQIKWSRNTQQESSCHEMYQKSTLEVHRIPSFYCSYWNSWHTSPNICIRGSGKNQDIAPQLLYKWCPENVIFTTMLILSFYGCCHGGINFKLYHFQKILPALGHSTRRFAVRYIQNALPYTKGYF